jgi:hypothetical protein
MRRKVYAAKPEGKITVPECLSRRSPTLRRSPRSPDFFRETVGAPSLLAPQRPHKSGV